MNLNHVHRKYPVNLLMAEIDHFDIVDNFDSLWSVPML